MGDAASDQDAAAENDQSAAASARPVHWSYTEDEGPAGWGDLSPAYSDCAEGMHQSPINIVTAEVAGEVSWSAAYGNTSLQIAHTEHVDDILDNGHTIQVTVDEGSSLEVQGQTYSLAQFHFHAPSEHTVNGASLPMEMHLVHAADDGALAVVGILFEEVAEPNENMSKILANLPAAKGETNDVEGSGLALEEQLPTELAAYHYSGSLTTPPCSEEVQWLVLQDPVGVSAEQIETMSARIAPNNRPTQPLNDRTVMAASIANPDDM